MDLFFDQNGEYPKMCPASVSRVVATGLLDAGSSTRATIMGSVEFYDLLADPYEHSDLLHRAMTLAEQRHYDWLQVQIQALRESR